ncbi:aminotransferase class I/II-fold pyridoxal phosphate-dependent enzyme [Shewanella gelidii]|uniref:8-amino-7-oxononanoate synthase n=1 Tax=Shewanella gelidii TaxID=1642821 RepID=A0A917JTM2_9GAMM|nr:8-amino-7-oxononanoate synthase [Shewanella gelidii]MCL1098331.1 8-amino-7-oxononanoate synthase [Shewanella gelidii]GGI84446.1 8-amino-7-oxononanoate synthase [Shewanella gelidii]
MSKRLSARIADTQQQLSEQGLLRTRSCHSEPNLTARDLLNFCDNDYLGLSQSLELKQAAAEGAELYGVGSGASPLVSGYQTAHQQLEQLLCQRTGHEAALLFCSGFAANEALVKTLFRPSDVVLTDKLIHASVIDAVQASGARLVRFAHNDTVNAEHKLAHFSPLAVMTESVFSMDGDIAPLEKLAAIAQNHDAYFIVDDAHGFGVIGKNSCGASMLCPSIDIQVVTFGKALGCQGAAILGRQKDIDFLVANARHYIYSTALAPVSAFVAYKAIEMLANSNHLQRQLSRNIIHFRKQCLAKGIVLTESSTPIQPIIIGESEKMMQIAELVKAEGFRIGAIRPPTVPSGSARLRVTLSARHQQAQISGLVEAMRCAINQVSPTLLMHLCDNNKAKDKRMSLSLKDQQQSIIDMSHCGGDNE